MRGAGFMWDYLKTWNNAGLKHGSIFQEVCKHTDVHFSSRATRRDSSAWSTNHHWLLWVEGLTLNLRFTRTELPMPQRRVTVTDLTEQSWRVPHILQAPVTLTLWVCVGGGCPDPAAHVQKFGLKVCLKQWHSTYENLIDQAGIPSLAVRRKLLKLCQLYNINIFEWTCNFSQFTYLLQAYLVC